MVVLDEIAVALDQRLAAVVTMCVFQISNQSGEITRVDVAKPRFFSNFRGPEQISGCGVFRTGHLIVLVESSHMPGNIGRDAGKKFR